MGKSNGANGSSVNTGTSTTQLPQWITNAGMTNLNQAYNVAQNMLGPYTGQIYAGLTNGAQADIAGLQSLPGSTQPAYNTALGTAGNLTGYQAPTVNPGSIAGTNLSSYMDPFTQNVIGSGMQAIDTQRRQALNSNADQARSQQAFGGSRQGVMEGATNAGAALQAGQLASQLQAQNFAQAQAAANQDVQTNYQGQVANQNAANNSANTQLNAANSLGSLGTNSQNSYLQALQAALQGQTLSQQNTQGQLNANQQAYQAAQQFPIQQLQIPLSALGMTPYGSTTNTQQSQQSYAPQSGAMQGVGAGLGILGSLFGGSGGGIVGGLAGLAALSDRRLKTDIVKHGTHAATGLPMYSYRYKGDAKNTMKMVGPMAQDIEKKYPTAVGTLGGVKVVDPRFINSMNLGGPKWNKK